MVLAIIMALLKGYGALMIDGSLDHHGALSLAGYVHPFFRNASVSPGTSSWPGMAMKCV